MRNRIAAVAVLALAACGGVNKAKVTAEAQQLVAQYSPQVAPLGKSGEALAAKLKSLPADFPGVADLGAKITAHQGKVAALQKRVEELPADLEATLTVGKDADVTALLEGFKKEVPAELAAAGPRLQELSSQLAALQAKAAEGATATAAK